MRYYTLSTLLLLFLLAGCGGKKSDTDSGAEQAAENTTTDQQDDAARQRPKVLTEDAEGTDYEQPLEPEQDQYVDLMSWYDKSYKSFAKEFDGFTSSDMHPVKDFGICRKVSVAFPEGGDDDKPGILICDLYGAYNPDSALEALGIPTSGRSVDENNKWCTYRSDDERILVLRTRFVRDNPNRTNQLLIQFSR